MNKTKWRVLFSHRQEEYWEDLDTVEEAFNFVDTMENSDRGGYGKAIWFGGVPEYVRAINEEAGIAYWVSLATDEKFVEYRR